MAQKTVGVQELESHFSSHLQEVKNGATLVITERGKPVARLLPIPPLEGTVEERLQQLLKAGVVTWSGRRLSPDVPTFPVQGPKTVSEILLEDRD